MIDAPTLILEDDERTVVSAPGSIPVGPLPDPTNPGTAVKSLRPYSPSAAWPFRAALLLALAAFVAGIVGFLTAWLVHERQAATRLREELQRVAARPHDRSHLASPGRVAAGHLQASAPPRLGPDLPPELFEDRLSEAVNLLVENRFPEALQAYRELHASIPDDPVLADVLAVIEAKLGCRYSEQGDSGRCP